MVKVIVNGKIILKDKILNNHGIIYNEKIIDIIEYRNLTKYKEITEIIDAKGHYICPGFIDLHIHGCMGHDVMDATKESLETIAKTLCKTGVTSFLPTTMTMSEENIKSALENIRLCINHVKKGAKILGVHLEGPFISAKYKGAQNEKYIKKPSYDFIKNYIDILKIITLAPEEDMNFEFIKKVKKNGITISMGHTNTSFEEALDAIDNGITYATHTFNGMTGLNHRKPGAVGAIFTKDIYCELIADKVHVHKGLFQMFIDINKVDKVILITDSMRAGFMGVGQYELGGQRVDVDISSARLIDGTLAGSILKLNEALKNIKENTNYSLYEIIKMVTINPAKAIGVDKYIGSISKGKFADFTLFNNDFDIWKTFINGEIVYEEDKNENNSCG